MSGETNLSELLKSLSATLMDGVFVFATVVEGSVPDNITPRMMFAEAEGITLILRKPEAGSRKPTRRAWHMNFPVG